MNNKILMSLVAASISAMASAPQVIQAQELNKDTSKDTINLETIDLEKLQPAQATFVVEMQNQLDAMLNKKTPSMRISESINILVENYGHNNASLKQEVLEKLGLSQSSNRQDSTTVKNSVYNTGGAASSCHAACHSACHGACHGARGWR